MTRIRLLACIAVGNKPLTRRELTLSYLQVVDRKNIGPRILWNTTLTYDRPVNADGSQYDKALRTSIQTRGMINPPIVFRDDRGDLWLISGGRRLSVLDQAAQGKDYAVPVVIVTSTEGGIDGLFTLLRDEYKRQSEDDNQETVAPMSWSQRLQYGLVVRGWLAYQRRAGRRSDVRVENYSEFLGIKESEWASLRLFSQVFYQYDKRKDAIPREDLAKSLLADVDAGMRTVHQARLAYQAARPERPTIGGPTVMLSAKEWEKQGSNIALSLNQLARALRDFERIPGKTDIRVVEEIHQTLLPVRTRLNALISTITRHLYHNDPDA